MRLRTAAAVVGTAGGLALLLSFRTPGATAPARVGTASAAPPAPTPNVTTTSAPASVGRGSTATTTTTAGQAANAALKGPVVSTRYGNVQVQVDTSGGRITDVVALALPSDRRRSAEISSYAAPILHDEALQAQSAQIDVVSGATYTSDAYARSLQAALDGHG
jgi:uncharacterized protein with FMN-binding domain